MNKEEYNNNGHDHPATAMCLPFCPKYGGSLAKSAHVALKANGIAPRANEPDALVNACTLASHSLRRLLAVAYRCSPDGMFILCKTCGSVSPVNEDRASFRINHDKYCDIAAAIVAEQAIHDALREAESQRSNHASPVGGKNE